MLSKGEEHVLRSIYTCICPRAERFQGYHSLFFSIQNIENTHTRTLMVRVVVREKSPTKLPRHHRHFQYQQQQTLSAMMSVVCLRTTRGPPETSPKTTHPGNSEIERQRTKNQPRGERTQIVWGDLEAFLFFWGWALSSRGVLKEHLQYAPLHALLLSC